MAAALVAVVRACRTLSLPVGLVVLLNLALITLTLTGGG